MINIDPVENQKKTMIHHRGKTYFSGKTEQNVFFILTIIMLLLGFFEKLGVL